MKRTIAFLLIASLGLAAGAGAVTVTTPDGDHEVFSRGELLDLAGLLQLAGADVAYAAAAGSYTAVRGSHTVQFTPGGTLAVIDGRLTPLPGPVRTMAGKVVGSLDVASALLLPLEMSLTGNVRQGLSLTPVGGGDRISVSLLREAAGPLLVVSGTSMRPVVRTDESGVVVLLYPSPVELAQPVAPRDEVRSVTARDRRVDIRLSPGIEVSSAYRLDNPPRFVLRLGTPEPQAGITESRRGPLVVLDPGHGGEDQGASGPGGELEKNITLAVARMTKAHLQTARITTRLTRDDDEGLSLQNRTAMANRLRADVFVSIHANASPARGARGAETYFMSVDASDPQAEQAALRENASASENTLGLILWDLAHVANLNASAALAGDIQQTLNELDGSRDRGVRQAPFVVLTGATMPAALVEVGFLSNPDDAARLARRDSQERIARALASAIVSFLRTPQQQPEP